MPKHTQAEEDDFIAAVKAGARILGLADVRLARKRKATGVEISIGNKATVISPSFHFTRPLTTEKLVILFGPHWPEPVKDYFSRVIENKKDKPKTNGAANGHGANGHDTDAVAAVAGKPAPLHIRRMEDPHTRRKMLAAAAAAHSAAHRQFANGFAIMDGAVDGSTVEPVPILTADEEFAQQLAILEAAETAVLAATGTAAPASDVPTEEKPAATEIPAAADSPAANTVPPPAPAENAAPAAAADVPAPEKPPAAAAAVHAEPKKDAVPAREVPAEEKSPLLNPDNPPIFRRLFDAGFRTVTEIFVAMNRYAPVAARHARYDITLEPVHHALMNSEKAFGEDRRRIDILYYRILQAVNRRRSDTGLSMLQAEEFFDVQRAAVEGSGAEAKIARASAFVHESLLNVLDRPMNLHFQTMEQLLEKCGPNPEQVTALLANPLEAYVLERGDIRARPALQYLAAALQCDSSVIFAKLQWSKVYQSVHGKNDELEELLVPTGRRGAAVPPPKHAPAPLPTTTPKMTPTTVRSASRPAPAASTSSPAAPAQQPAAPVASRPATAPLSPIAPAVAAAAAMAAAPVPVQPAASVKAPETEVKSAWHNAAREILTTYRELSPASLTLLRKVEGISMMGTKTALQTVAHTLHMDEEEGGFLLQKAKNRLGEAARLAGVEVSAEKIIAALQLFEADEQRMMLAASQEGHNDAAIGRQFSPIVPEDQVRASRTALLSGMARALGHTIA